MNYKININTIKIVPKSISSDFKLCFYGNIKEELLSWVKTNNLKLEKSKSFTNIIIPDNIKLSDLFLENEKFEYMDGFSPNLNKNLHIGHFSNFVIAKCLKSLDICHKTVSIYGNTLKNTDNSYLEKLKNYFKLFRYNPDLEFLASEMKYNGDLLIDGKDDYKGTKIFNIEDEKIVGIKSDNTTSYFYQDVALAEILNNNTLYLTGKEQENHFRMLNKLFPKTKHIGLGLVLESGKKMSSRDNNIISMEELIELLKSKFNNNIQLVYNVFAGNILKSNLSVDKNIDLNLINNVKQSLGYRTVI